MTTLILAVSGASKLEAQRAQRLAALRRLVGPGLLVAVGYVDPGNWATDIAGGAGFGYRLLTVVVMASLLAMAFQTLVARVVLATGEDLATLTARHLPRPLARASWLAGEAAILATAFAEMMGGAIALNILFGMSVPLGVVVTGAATAAVLSIAQMREGMHETVVNLLIGVVAFSFLVLMVQIQPEWHAVGQGVMETGSALRDSSGMMIALGVLGATLMPHNLYLHAGTLAERVRGVPAEDRKLALRIARNDTVVSLGLAMLVNAAIMIVAAASLTQGSDISSLSDAHAAMRSSLGAGAGLLFALALYAAGQSSAITGVMAGRILTQGFLGTAVSDRRRAILTRIGVAALAVAIMTVRGSSNPDELLVLSQVVLGIALPFALVPLVMLAARRDVMGDMALGRGMFAAASAATSAVIGLNLYMMVA